MNMRICIFSIGMMVLNLLNAHENDILLKQDTLQMSEALETFASRGLKLLFMGQFEDALDDFNHNAKTE